MTSTIENQESKKWPQFLVVLTATVALFTAGLHTGWPSPSLPKLLSDDYPFDVTNEEASYITIIGSVGYFCGSFVGYFLLDKIGRRKSLLLISLPQVTSFLMIILSYQVMELLYVARFIGGVGESMSITMSYVYTGEIAEPTIRGRLCTLLSITLYLGVLVINIVGSYLSIKMTAVCCIPLPILFVILFWKMPESPYYLLMQKQDEAAAKVLMFLRKKDNVSEEVTKMKSDVERQISESGTFRDILIIDSNRRAFLVTLGARFFQLSTGVAAFNLYLQLLLKEATETLDPQIGSIIILSLQLFLTGISTFTVDKWGRKPLLLVSVSGCCLNLVLQTIFFILKEHTSVDVSVIDWFPLVMMFLHITLYSLGLGVVVSVLTSEMYSASVKSKSSCLVSGLYALGTLLFTKYYQLTADGFGLTVPFSTFAVLSFIGVLFFYLLVPETKGKTLEEVQQKLKGLGVVVGVLTGEMYSASVKAKSMCLVNGLYVLGILLFTKYYQLTADGLGLTVPFSTFALLTFIGVLFFYFLVPETKGKTLEEIQQKLKGNGNRKAQIQ